MVTDVSSDWDARTCWSNGPRKNMHDYLCQSREAMEYERGQHHCRAMVVPC